MAAEAFKLYLLGGMDGDFTPKSAPALLEECVCMYLQSTATTEYISPAHYYVTQKTFIYSFIQRYVLRTDLSILPGGHRKTIYSSSSPIKRAAT